jgi:hypothetical protein
MNTIRRNIKASLETRDSYDQACREGAALRGELGINAQLIALSEVAKVERANGNEDAYQAIKAEAYRLREAYMAGVSDSDQAIPVGAAILDVVADRIELAMCQADEQTARRLNRVRENVARGARLRWSFGDLHIASVNSPGVTYVLSCGRCPCKATKPCWHLELLDVLLEMADTAAGDADLEAELDELEAERLAAQHVITRICAARSRYDWAA